MTRTFPATHHFRRGGFPAAAARRCPPSALTFAIGAQPYVLVTTGSSSRSRATPIHGPRPHVLPIVHRPKPAAGIPHCIPEAPSGRASAASACKPTRRSASCEIRVAGGSSSAEQRPKIPRIHAISSFGNSDSAISRQHSIRCLHLSLSTHL